MVTQEFIDQVAEAIQTFSDSLENANKTGRATFIKTVGEIDQTVSLPGVQYNKSPLEEGATAVAYVQIPWSVLSDALAAMGSATGGAETVNAILQDTTIYVTDRSGYVYSADTAAAAKQAKAEWDNTYKSQIETATNNANTATQNANTATAGASNVNAQLSGMTVTITNRQGTSTSVNIGFEIYRTYGSVAAMNADAANVPDGRFVMIATSDPTSVENARLYAKNSSGGFSFLSDLDQASSAAWSDWLNNQKPLIEQATADANSAADLANAKANKADTAADNATSIYNTVRTWFNGDDNNGFKNTSESWLSTTQQTWNDWFSNSLANGVRKLWNDFWASINSSWNGFFGTSADDSNGVRKIWSTWYTNTQTAWNNWFSDSLADGVRKKWNDFWPACKNTWEGWFGTSDASGVQKQWKDLKNDCETSEATRKSNETGRVNAESSRVTAEQGRVNAESTRVTNETTRGTNEATRITNESARATAETARETQASSDHTRAEGDHTTATTDHGTATTDHNTATADHTTADGDHTRAENDHTRAESDHTTADTDHTTAVSDSNQAGTDHATAVSDHNTAEDDHTRAESDHTTADADHTTAVSDHGTAVSDHTRAEGDHTTAYADHATAVSDNTQATSDHATAVSDHGTAESDHTTAVEDHITSGEDHTASVEATGYANDQGDYAKNMADHPSYLADGTQAHPGDTGYFYSWDYDTQQYVKGARLNIDFSTMTSEQQEALAEAVLEAIGFDQTPTQGSANAVTSNGIYNANQDIYTAIGNERTRAEAAEQANADDIDAIEALIPSQATSSNQLADKEFVNSSISTATATYRGAYNLVSDLHLTITATQADIATELATAVSTADNNDYAFVQIPTANDKPTEIARIDRYKYNGTAWAFEYSLNNSGYTQAQWAAINSGITSALTTKLTDLPTNAELTELLAGKQDNITFASIAVCESIVGELT